MAKDEKPDSKGALGEEEDEAEIPWDDELNAWAEDETLQGTELRVTVFRQEKRGGPREKVWEFIDEIIGSHELGLRFGGGRYHLYGRIIQDGVTVKTIRRIISLGSTYTEAMNEAKRAAAPMAGPVSPFSNINWMDVLKAAPPVLLALRELFGGRSTFEGMEEAQKVMARVLEDSAKSQIKMIGELRREVSGMPAQNVTKDSQDPAEDPDMVKEIKEYIFGAIKEYGPGLLEAAGLKLKGAIGAVKRDEVFQSLAQNERLFSRVYSHLVEGATEEDKALIAKVLQKLSANGLGFKLPQQTREPVT